VLPLDVAHVETSDEGEGLACRATELGDIEESDQRLQQVGFSQHSGSTNGSQRIEQLVIELPSLSPSQRDQAQLQQVIVQRDPTYQAVRKDLDGALIPQQHASPLRSSTAAHMFGAQVLPAAGEEVRVAELTDCT
jgi:hypothetical protein